VITNDLKHTSATTVVGAVTGSAFVITSEMIHGWAKAGSAVVGFFILCVTLTHATVKLHRYINRKGDT
jgi:hypothetical protein